MIVQAPSLEKRGQDEQWVYYFHLGTTNLLRLCWYKKLFKLHIFESRINNRLEKELLFLSAEKTTLD